MPYVIGLFVLAFLLTYPIGRWQRRRMRRHPEELTPGPGETGADPGDPNPATAEAMLRGNGTGTMWGGRP